MGGSIVNMVTGTGSEYEPKVGDGATILYRSDRKAGTIVEVGNNGKTVVVQKDKSKRVDNNGLSESQDYEFERDPQGTKITFTKRQNGQYIRRGDPMKGGQRVALGWRDEFYDFSF